MNKVVNFIKESIEELKRTQWPNKQQAIRLTTYVIGVSFGIGLFVALFDYSFKQLLTWLLTR